MNTPAENMGIEEVKQSRGRGNGQRAVQGGKTGQAMEDVGGRGGVGRFQTGLEAASAHEPRY